MVSSKHRDSQCKRQPQSSTSPKVLSFSRNNQLEVLENLKGLVNPEDLEKEYEIEAIKPNPKTMLPHNNIDPSHEDLETKASIENEVEDEEEEEEAT
jgi:hypothetical protein